MKKETAKYWWLFIGFLLFGWGITGTINNLGGLAGIAVWAYAILGAASIAWGLSHY